MKRQSKAATTTTITATKKQLERAFAEWDHRYRENPESFMHEVRHLLGETSESYGKGLCGILPDPLGRYVICSRCGKETTRLRVDGYDKKGEPIQVCDSPKPCAVKHPKPKSEAA